MRSGWSMWWLVVADTHQTWSLVIVLAVGGRGRNAKEGNRWKAGLWWNHECSVLPPPIHVHVTPCSMRSCRDGLKFHHLPLCVESLLTMLSLLCHGQVIQTEKKQKKEEDWSLEIYASNCSSPQLGFTWFWNHRSTRPQQQCFSWSELVLLRCPFDSISSVIREDAFCMPIMMPLSKPVMSHVCYYSRRKEQYHQTWKVSLLGALCL